MKVSNYKIISSISEEDKHELLAYYEKHKSQSQHLTYNNVTSLFSVLQVPTEDNIISNVFKHKLPKPFSYWFISYNKNGETGIHKDTDYPPATIVSRIGVELSGHATISFYQDRSSQQATHRLRIDKLTAIDVNSFHKVQVIESPRVAIYANYMKSFCSLISEFNEQVD